MATAHRSDAFRLDAFEPATLSLLRNGGRAERAEAARVGGRRPGGTP